MDLAISEKNALITGGSSGIGAGIAETLAQEGVNLAIASRNPAHETIEKLRSYGVKVEPISADVSKEDQTVGMVEEGIRKLGSIDFYINNAAWTWHQPITKIESESWFNTINTNLSGAMWACKTVSKHMIERGKGSIVIVGSTVRFAPSYCETSYRISKTGLKCLAENLAIELAPFGIRANMVTPGHFVTRMTSGDRIEKEKVEKFRDRYIPMRRFGQCQETGPVVAFLLSENTASYITGSEIVVDGGLQHRPVTVICEEEIRNLNL